MVGWSYICRMETVGLYEAKTRLSQLVRDAMAGQDVVITRNGKAAVRLVPVTAESAVREMGFFSSGVTVALDFDATPEEFRDYL